MDHFQNKRLELLIDDTKKKKEKRFVEDKGLKIPDSIGISPSTVSTRVKVGNRLPVKIPRSDFSSVKRDALDFTALRNSPRREMFRKELAFRAKPPTRSIARSRIIEGENREQ